MTHYTFTLFVSIKFGHDENVSYFLQINKPSNINKRLSRVGFEAVRRGWDGQGGWCCQGWLGLSGAAGAVKSDLICEGQIVLSLHKLSNKDTEI